MYTGITRESFYANGTILQWNDLLKIRVSGIAIRSITCFNVILEIPSIPHEFLGKKLFITEIISSLLMSNSKHVFLIVFF